MCLACIEYVDGKLTAQEFRANKSEFPDGTAHLKLAEEILMEDANQRQAKIAINLIKKA